MLRLSVVMVIKAVICLVFGILLLAVPEALLSFLGVTTNAGGLFMAREYGASLIGNLLLTWFARNAGPSIALRAITLDLFIYDLIGFVVALTVTLAGVMNGFGWFIVAIYLLLALGFGYYALQKSEP